MKRSKPALIRLIVCIVLILIFVPVGIFTDVFSFDMHGVEVNASKVLKLFVMILCVLSVETIIVMILGIPKPKRHRTMSMISIIQSLMKYLAFIIILCWGLSIIGVSVSTIVASVGILTLVIGFSAESLIADVVTGTFMIFENQYNVGDIVEVDNFRGTVTSIGIRTTCITDTGDNVKIVNNSAMKNILNRSDRVSRSVSDISIPYATDLEALEAQLPKLLNDMYNAHTDVFKNVPRYLGVNQLADSAVVLRFVADVDEANIYSGTRILNHDLLLGFRKLGVECPFPQLDVHMDR